jgi:DNA-binding NarL/FixJ family response regulator
MVEGTNVEPINVLILSNNHITRSGLRRILESHPGFHVLGEGSVGSTTIVESLIRQQPEVILLDIDAKGADALGFIKKQVDLGQSSSVIVLCDLGQDEAARKALALGASGIVLKNQPPTVLIAAILSLSESSKQDIAIKHVEREKLKGTQPTLVKQPHAVAEKVNSLTAREREVIRLIAMGLKNKEVASRLNISDITVRHHLTNIFNKLDVSDRQKLLILAHTHGIVDLTFAPAAS